MKKFCLLICLLTFFAIHAVFLNINTVVHAKAVTSDPVTVKIATFNIAAGRGIDGFYNLSRIANAIEKTEADIIGLQEVDVHWGDRSRKDHMIEKLANRLNMEYYFAPIYDLDPVNENEPRRQFGVAVLSKYPITAAVNREITRLSTQNPNPFPRLTPGFLEAEINVEGAELAFYVTHLDYRSDPTIREMQVGDMKEIMKKNTYSILVGDLNATPNALELKPLQETYTDVWRTSGNGQGYTYPTTKPDRRIDYILVSPRIKVNKATILESTASDHLPVIAKITLIPGNHSYNLKGMEWLVRQLYKQGGIHKLTLINRHLQVLSYYEQNNLTSKLVKHLYGLKELLNLQKESGEITEKAWEELQHDIDYFMKKYSE